MVESFGVPGEVAFPFQRKPLFFLIVTFLAAGNNIAFGGFTPPGDGYDVIHGELFGWKRTAAVVTDAFVTFSFPPLGLAHFTCLVTFALDVVFRKIIGVWVHFLSAESRCRFHPAKFYSKFQIRRAPCGRRSN